MLVIRFQRIGRKNDPAFRIVVTERRSKPKSGELEILGSYQPKTKETVLKNERILYWISKGAKVSDTVHNLLISKGVIKGSKINTVKTIQATIKESEAKTPNPELIPEQDKVTTPDSQKEATPEST
ncbi:MAG: 30S ribosomal protein S16 [Candidatus Sungiibacteriota bacterium]|uniref:Small ribosomal subunit protein bS16 n=1 Tax=Candidatus Sungiibacteriota bacterium TaxID=2750080 RepID=A0A7T5RJ64_9BACT|nr:MAG: 30S ribosomal protein S16 [Candidatus Sungbacteria bacterium]